MFPKLPIGVLECIGMRKFANGSLNSELINVHKNSIIVPILMQMKNLYQTLKYTVN